MKISIHWFTAGLFMMIAGLLMSFFGDAHFVPSTHRALFPLLVYAGNGLFIAGLFSVLAYFILRE